MSDKYYLGFDAGTQSVKVAVYDEDQHCLAMDTAKTHLAYPQPGWVQMDVDEYSASSSSAWLRAAARWKRRAGT